MKLICSFSKNGILTIFKLFSLHFFLEFRKWFDLFLVCVILMLYV